MKINNIDKIKEDFKKVICYSQSDFHDIDDKVIDNLFNKWYEAKKYYIDALEGELIYEVPTPITITLSAEEKETRLESFLDEIEDYNLRSFLALNRETFFENKTNNDYISYNNKKISKGMKITRALKFFINDEKTLDTYQTKISMLLQETKVTGRLCLSVHPLDFLSSSENTYNWRSCHSLNGDFRAGNLSYMLDSSTVICYLKGEDDVKLPRFPKSVPWNNKKWRMLLFFAEKKMSMFAGRQYPFFNRGILDNILEATYNAKFIFWYHPEPWSNFKFNKIKTEDGYRYLDDNYVILGEHPYAMNDLVKDCNNPLHYNDLLHSTCYTPYYTYTGFSRWNYKKGTIDSFSIGSEVPCLYCGENLISESNLMLCHNCNREMHPDHYCAECGHYIGEGDGVYVEGEFICDNCAWDVARRCEMCGEYFFEEHTTWDEDLCGYVCDHCLKNREEEGE